MRHEILACDLCAEPWSTSTKRGILEDVDDDSAVVDFGWIEKDGKWYCLECREAMDEKSE